MNGESGRRYIEGLGVPSTRIRVIPQATTSPHSAVAPGPTAGGRIRLLVVCRLVELKGVQILLDVLPRCEPGRFELTIVGDGPYRTSLEERARGVEVPVTFAGHLAGEELAHAYAAADYLVFPTLSDEWGLVVNEAFAAGLPVIGSEYSQAVQELVLEGSNGWKFYPDRPETLEQAIQRTLTVTREEWNRLSAASQATAAELRPDVVAAAFLAAAQDARTRNAQK